MNPEIPTVPCPSCGLAQPATNWTHPTCPNCQHSNAMIRGKCRDCGHTDIERYGSLVEYLCFRGCGARFFASGKILFIELPKGAVDHVMDPDSGYIVSIP